MYEKLDKLRAELSKAKQRRAEADAKVKQLEQKLKDAENTQILADVGALKLTPEQLAQFLEIATSGQLVTSEPVVVKGSVEVKEDIENDDMESEDFDDEEM
ncbi:uncharacterized protein DUF4315 [Herbinix hemicellulosilytica]|uniref:DUF4315 family protein n=1 Tax=Herbinix hemicellulosilytica TaxID=1564487 RepID=A0A0H5SHY2_HERHM|nr:DUF4315 family protein [Herbinix hemicellulosilytica]RBP57093.1 uncharacterized protein DUF4315 [Herbinix hemicellulosilytica]CRZ35102.1 hypothetical protein HHT355_1903 [Herbinix hemicellulosilytica]